MGQTSDGTWKQRIIDTLEPHRGEPVAPKDHFTYTAELLEPLIQEILREKIEALAQQWEADIQRYEHALRIGATGAWETRITNTMGHLSDLKRLLIP